MRNITVYLASFLLAMISLNGKIEVIVNVLLRGTLKGLDVKKYFKNATKTKKSHANFYYYCYEICSKAQQLVYGR